MGFILNLITQLVKNSGQAQAIISVLVKYLSADHLKQLIAEFVLALNKIEPVIQQAEEVATDVENLLGTSAPADKP